MLHKHTPGLWICLALVSVILLTGCEKEPESTTPPAIPNITQTVDDVAKEAEVKGADVEKVVEEKTAEVEKVVEEVKAVATDFQTDMAKTLADVKKQAASMSIEDLTTMAMMYKDKIMSNEGIVNDLMAKMKDIPLTEQLGDNAKQLKAEINTLTSAIKPLKERYDVYIAKLTELKADISSLELK